VPWPQTQLATSTLPTEPVLFSATQPATVTLPLVS
jgi:hypothetical protein